MPTVSLAPNLDVPGYGAGQKEAWQDSSDATYVTISAGSNYRVEFTSTTLPAGAAVQNIKLWVRTRDPSDAGYNQGFQVWLLDASNGFSDLGGTPDAVWWNNWDPVGTWVDGLVKTRTGALTQTQIDGLAAQVSDSYSLSVAPFLEVSKVWIDVFYRNPPGAPTWTGPASSVTTTRKPPLDWDHVAGTDGNAQSAFEARIFTVAQASIGGFDVGSSLSTLDSGRITSGTTSWTPSDNLANGATYRAYVRTIAITNGVEQVSPWSAAREFTIAIPVPTPTSVTPASGATVTSSFPALGASLAAMAGGTATARRWQIASDSGFSVNFQELTESPPTAAAKSGAVDFLKLAGAARLPQGVWYIRCRGVDEYGVTGPFSAATTFTIAHAPTASTSRLPGSGQAVEYSTLRQVTWVFADPDWFDSQTKYEAELWKQSAPGTKILSGLTVSTVGAHSFAIPDTTWRGVDLRWRVRTTDLDNVAGAWSAESSFFMYDAPVIAVTSPSEGAVITTAQPTITWTFSATHGRTQATRRVVIARVSDSSVIADSGTLATTATSWQIPSASILVGVNYAVTLTVVDSAGLTSIETNAFTATYVAPTVPVFVVDGSEFDSLGRVMIDYSTATSDATNLGWVVLRRVNGGAAEQIARTNSLTKFYYDYLCPSAASVEYAVAQVTESFGSEVQSAFSWLPFVGDSGYWLVCPERPSLNLKLHLVSADDFEDEQEMATQNLIGRGRRVEYGTRFGQVGSLTARFLDREEPGGLTAREQRLALEALRSSQQKVYLRNAFGDVWQIAISSAKFTRQAGVGLQEITTVSLSYSELTG
jgi:hypothetical protein